MNTKTISLLCLAAFSLLLPRACNSSESCPDNTSAYLVAGFRQLPVESEQDSTLEGLSVRAIPENGNPVSLYSNTNAARISLPLDPKASSIRFVFELGASSDTLLLNYEANAYLLSYDCGFASRFGIVGFSCSGSLFKEILLDDNTVDPENPDDVLHLRLFL